MVTDENLSANMQALVRLHDACVYFNTHTVVRVAPNGYDPKTGKYDIPGCFVNAASFGEAIAIIQEYNRTGNKENIFFDPEL